MSRTQWIITLFWVFVGTMLLWQCASYNNNLNQQTINHPTQGEYFYYDTNLGPKSSADAQVDGPLVVQTDYAVDNNKPSEGMFITRVTLKNVGKAKAVDVQVNIRPYRGTIRGDEDNGHSADMVPIDDNDPLSLFGQWLTFPDLAPGESSTQTATFSARSNLTPGTNPNPKILFSPEKPKS